MVYIVSEHQSGACVQPLQIKAEFTVFISNRQKMKEIMNKRDKWESFFLRNRKKCVILPRKTPKSI
ncbi:hypothetical protein EEL49_10825 [Muribaculaceae bacterium Isolate-104 (HZI)]|nr:hypothetical protein EEL49_10825 [Muribaculaceae bacterium Isolate-104 (HZI)]